MQTWTYSQPTPRLVALAGPIAGDAGAYLIELAELLMSMWIISPGCSRS
jgi:hypothetical protein